MTDVFESFGVNDTFEYAKSLAKKAKRGQIYTLNGDLGAGKTVFTQGFAKGLLIDEYIDSPTFTIIKEYVSTKMPFYHFDVYRIGDVSEMDEIGYEEYFYGDGVCVIEWAELISEIIPKDAINVRIEKDLSRGTDYRKITVTDNCGD